MGISQPRAQLVKTQRFHRYKCPQFFALTDGPVPFVVIIKKNSDPTNRPMLRMAQGENLVDLVMVGVRVIKNRYGFQLEGGQGVIFASYAHFFAPAYVGLGSGGKGDTGKQPAPCAPLVE